MIKELYYYLKKYFELANLNKKYLIGMISTSFYNFFLILSPLFASWIIKYLSVNNLKMTYISLILFICSILIYSLLYYLNDVFYSKNMAYLYKNLHNSVFNKVIDSDINFITKISRGKLLNTINHDIIMIGDLINEIIVFFSSILMVVLVSLIVGFYNIYIGLIIIIFSMCYIYLTNIYDRKSMFYFKKQTKEQDKYSSLLNEMINGRQEIKNFNIKDKLLNKTEFIKKRWNKHYKNKR